MFWSIISSFVQNKNAAIWRIILFEKQSSRAAPSCYNHRSCPLLLVPAGSTLHLAREERVSKTLHPQAETRTDREESSVGEKATIREKIKEQQVMR